MSVDDDMLKKVVLHSVATAFASSVFPVPGGPTINTPCLQRDPENSTETNIHLKISTIHFLSQFQKYYIISLKISILNKNKGN